MPGARLTGPEKSSGTAQAEQNWEIEERTYQEVYPRVGATAIIGAGMFTPVWWGMPVLSMAGGVAGGATGKAVLARREAERQEAQDRLVEREVMGRDVQQASFTEADETSRRRFITPSVHQEPNGRVKNEE